tara:strand:+ start:130 stop:378 length:249 start_codon:yes stop_codon:yes gene_type:complete
MSEIIKTVEDGWDCVPELQEAVNKIEELDHFLYEINRCQRDHELDYMVEEMKEKLQEAIDILENIDTDQEFETVDDLEEIEE